MDNTRILQRNGRLTNISPIGALPRYNNIQSSCDCYMTTKSGCGCSAPIQSACDYETPAAGRCTKTPIAISSIGIQKWRDIYDLEKGFKAGTIFCELDLPFCGMRGGKL